MHSEKQIDKSADSNATPIKNPVVLEEALSGKAKAFTLWTAHMKSRWGTYLIGAIAVALTNVTEVMVPKVIQWTVDSLSVSGSFFKRNFIWLLGIYTVQAIGRIVWRQTLGQQTHFAASRMKSLLWNRARFLPKERLETDLSPGELMNLGAGDVGSARMPFGFTLVASFDFVSWMLFTLIAMFTISPKLSLLTLSIMPILPFVLHHLAKREHAQHIEAQKQLSELSDLAAQSVGTVRLQRLTQSTQFWIKRLSDSAKSYGKKRLDVVYTTINFLPLTGIAPVLSYGILVYFGTQEVLSARISVGEFIAMQSYIFLIQAPLFELGTLVSEWQRSFASFGRLVNAYNQNEAPQLRSGGKNTNENKSANIVYEVKNLGFRYKGAPRSLFTNLSISLEAADRLAVKGPIGTGKSTLAQILGGLERNYEGSIHLYGSDIREYSHFYLRQNLALVSQKPFLFADTLEQNLRLQREASEDELWFWLRVAGIADEVHAFPDRLKTRLGEWGLNLSGGQKQRLTLARALIGRPKILILDDCLSAVDTKTEESILKSLDQELQNTTCIWIAHRDSTLRFCNKRIDFSNPEELGL